MCFLVLLLAMQHPPPSFFISIKCKECDWRYSCFLPGKVLPWKRSDALSSFELSQKFTFFSVSVLSLLHCYSVKGSLERKWQGWHSTSHINQAAGTSVLLRIQTNTLALPQTITTIKRDKALIQSALFPFFSLPLSSSLEDISNNKDKNKFPNQRQLWAQQNKSARI